MNCSVFDDEFINIIDHALASVQCSYPMFKFTNIKPSPSSTEYTSIKDVSDIIYNYNIARSLNILFPGALRHTVLSTDVKPSVKNKLILKFHKISFELSNNNKLSVNAFVFDPVVLQIRLARYFKQIKSSSAFKFTKENINKWPLSIDTSWLADCLGAKYSYGRMLDFADAEYDKYKQIDIDPFIFRRFFFAFLSDLPEIGNSAFDNYMITRDPSSSWYKAIQSELSASCNFYPEDLNNIISRLFTLV